jgi:hypothetical protein
MTTLPGAPSRPGTANLVVTIVLFVLLLGVGLLAVTLSGFFVMATDSCGATGVTCNTDAVVYALFAVWGGVALAVGGAAVGAIVSGARHRATWSWPLVGLGVVIIAFAGGVLLMSRVGSGSA